MSNKKLSRYYVLSQTVYDMLKKNSIDENNLNSIDKPILGILKNKSLSTPEKFLLYSQHLSKHIHKIREKEKNQKDDDEKMMMKVMDEKRSKNKIWGEQTTQTDLQPKVTVQSTQTDQSMQTTPIVQTTPKRHTPYILPKNFDEVLKDTFTDDDEEYENQVLRKKRFMEDKRSNASLGDELFGRPFDPKTPQVLRRSKRIQKRQMPTSFDDETEAAALEFAQEEFQDPQDRNYLKRLSTSPSLRIIEHKPSGSVITVSLDDIVDVVDEDEEIRPPKKRKRKTPKKTKSQKGGAEKISWQKIQ